MSQQTIFGLLYFILGLVLIGVGFPLLAGRVGRNRWYGFRIPKSYKSDENWLLINRYGARHLIRWASAMAGLGVFLIIANDADQAIVHWIIVGAPLLLIIPMALTLNYARQLP